MKKFVLALALALLVCQPAAAEFGSNADRGYGSSADSHGNFGGMGGGFMNNLRGLLDLGKGGRGSTQSNGTNSIGTRGQGN